MTAKVIKAIGLGATVIGFGVDIISGWVDEEKMDKKIEEKVNEVLTYRLKDKMKES